MHLIFSLFGLKEWNYYWVKYLFLLGNELVMCTNYKNVYVCNEQLFQEKASLQKTWGSLTMQVLWSTKQ